MLKYSFSFFIIAMIAAIFGFSSMAPASAGIAKVMFFVFLGLSIFSLVIGLMTGPPATPPD